MLPNGIVPVPLQDMSNRPWHELCAGQKSEWELNVDYGETMEKEVCQVTDSWLGAGAPKPWQVIYGILSAPLDDK